MGRSLVCLIIRIGRWSDAGLIIISRVFAWLLLEHFFWWGHSKQVLAIFKHDISFRVEQDRIVVVIGISQAVPVQWVAVFLHNNRLVCFDVLVQERERAHIYGDEICD